MGRDAPMVPTVCRKEAIELVILEYQTMASGGAACWDHGLACVATDSTIELRLLSMRLPISIVCVVPRNEKRPRIPHTIRSPSDTVSSQTVSVGGHHPDRRIKSSLDRTRIESHRQETLNSFNLPDNFKGRSFEPIASAMLGYCISIGEQFKSKRYLAPH